MSAVTFKNVITDNPQKKDESEEILKLFKAVASLQVKTLSFIEIITWLVSEFDTGAQPSHLKFSAPAFRDLRYTDFPPLPLSLFLKTILWR